MKTNKYNIHFITPCFCGGADPTKAEIRASSIRGQLRWWFRALGGTRNEEETIFGAAAGESVKSSSIIVRSAKVQANQKGVDNEWYKSIPSNGDDSLAYLLGFFCGRPNRIHNNGAIAPGETAEITIIYRRELVEPLKSKLDDALEAFFSIGAFGYRITRTAGAFWCEQYKLDEERWEKLEEKLKSKGFDTCLSKSESNNWIRLCETAEDWLKNKLRGKGGKDGEKGLKISSKSPSPLGSPTPRQTSALYLRPVKINDKIRLLFIEAPHDRVLGDKAKKANQNRETIIQQLKQKNLIG